MTLALRPTVLDRSVTALRNLKWNLTPRIEVRVIVQKEGELFIAFVPKLPGAISQGETVEEAIQNIREAIQALLESYSENRLPIPWKSEFNDAPTEGIERRIVVNV